MMEQGHRRTNSRYEEDIRFKDRSQYVRAETVRVQMEDGDEQPTFNRTQQERFKKPSKLQRSN